MTFGNFTSKKILASIIFLGLSVACHALTSVPPKEGDYRDQNGKIYQVSTSGASALSVTNQSGFCLLFWRYKKPKMQKSLELLKGQDCQNGNMENLNWNAGYSPEQSGKIILFPPDSFKDQSVRPIELNYIE